MFLTQCLKISPRYCTDVERIQNAEKVNCQLITSDLYINLLQSLTFWFLKGCWCWCTYRQMKIKYKSDVCKSCHVISQFRIKVGKNWRFIFSLTYCVYVFVTFFQRKQYQLGKEIFDKYIASSTSAVKLERGIVREMESFLLGNSAVS